MISVIRQLPDGMRACVRLDDSVYSRWFAVETLYADDAGVVSRSPEQLKMMGVIVVVCAAFGLTVSEAKTEIMGLRAKVVPESTPYSA